MSILNKINEEVNREEEIKQAHISPATNDYIKIMKSGNLFKITEWYLHSKAFKDKAITWIKKKWSNQSDTEIISDLLKFKTFPRPDPSFGQQKAYDIKHYVNFNQTVLFNVVMSGNIEMIPINILKKISKDIFTEIFMNGGTDWDSMWKPTTIKDILLKKKSTPQEYKNYFREL